MRAAAGKADTPNGIAAMRAELALTFDHIVFSTGLAAFDATPPGSVYVSGAADLVPVLRSDLLTASEAVSARREAGSAHMASVGSALHLAVQRARNHPRRGSRQQ